MGSLSTPWGMAQTQEVIGEGALNVSTAGHGGIMLNEEAVATLPKHIQQAGEKFGVWRCYEEDCAYALVMEFKPEWEREHIRKQLRSWERSINEFKYPWAIKEGPECVAHLKARLAMSDAELVEPFVKSNREWFPELFGLGHRCWICWELNCKGHEQEMIVVSATSGVSWEPPVPSGMVGVHACMGGRNKHGQYAAELKMFLVPAVEYEKRERYFVVDPSRHQAWKESEQSLTGMESAAAEA